MSEFHENAPLDAPATDFDRDNRDGLVLHEERVKTGEHETLETAEIRVRKRVVVEELTVTVPVRREVVDVVRIEADGTETIIDAAPEGYQARVEDRTGYRAYGESAAEEVADEAAERRHDPASGGFVVICFEERPVISTEVYAVERVRLDTVRDVHTETLTVDVRREEAELVESNLHRRH